MVYIRCWYEYVRVKNWPTGASPGGAVLLARSTIANGFVSPFGAITLARGAAIRFLLFLKNKFPELTCRSGQCSGILLAQRLHS